MSDFYYVYVLQSIKDDKFYTGYTKDLKRRPALLNKHINRKVKCLFILWIN